MNFLEAYEANKTQKVKYLGSIPETFYEVGRMRDCNAWPRYHIEGRWEVVREPRTIWINEYGDSVHNWYVQESKSKAEIAALNSMYGSVKNVLNILSGLRY